MNEKEINEAFDREYEKHIKDLDESNFVKLKMPKYYIAKHSDEDLQAAVLAEREACAKVCEEWGVYEEKECAAAIRARGKE